MVLLQSNKHFLAAVTAVVVWGFISIPLKALSGYNSFDVLFYRLIIAFVVMLLVALLFRRQVFRADSAFLRQAPRHRRNRFLLLILSSSVLITANWYSFIFIITHISVQAGALAYMICPILTALAAVCILHERLARGQWVAIGIAMLGIFLLIKGSLIAIFAAFFTAITYAFYLILQKKLNRFDPFNLLMVQIFFAIVFLCPIMLFNGSLPSSDQVFWYNILLIALLFTITPMFLTNYSLLGLKSSTTGILIYVSPILSFILAFVYFHEAVSTRQLLAYSLLATAVIVFNLSFGKRSDSLQ